MRIGGNLFLWMAVAAVSGLGSVTAVRADVLGYWPFNDPADPDVVIDLSGNGNDGEVRENVTKAVYTADGGGFSGLPGDYAMRFTSSSTALPGGGPSGPGGYVFVDGSTGAFASTVETNQITIGLWMFGSDRQAIDQVHFWAEPADDPDIELFDADDNVRGWQAHIPWSNGNVYFDTSGCCEADQERINALAPESSWKGQWNHWVFIKDGDYKAIYNNGVKFLEGINTDPLVDVGDGLGIGSTHDGGSTADGLIDEFIVFDNALTDTADGLTRVPMGALAEEGSEVWRLFTAGAASFTQPGINVLPSTNLATVDQKQAQLLIDTACNAEQDVTYTIASSDPGVIEPAGLASATFSAGVPPSTFLPLQINGPGTATLSTTNTGGCEDYTTEVTVFPIDAVDLKLVTAGMEVGDTQQSVAIGSYGAALERDVTESSKGTTYSSSDVNVATVDADGVITAVAEGSAEITSTNGGVSDVESVNVATQLTAIAFIMGTPEINEGDQGVLDLLTSLRFSGDPGQLDAGGLPPKVIPMDDDAFDTAVIDATFDLVLVSSTVFADKIGGSFRCVSIPMVFWEEGLNAVGNEGLAAAGGTSVGAGGTDDLKEFSDLFVLNPAHEIMQGVPTDADGFANVYDSPQDISWGAVGPNARSGAVIGGIASGAEALTEYDLIDEGTIIVAEAGGRRLNTASIILGRRVFLWLTDESADNLNETGRGIVSRAINWALGGERIPVVLDTLVVSGISQIEVGGTTQLVAEGTFGSCAVDFTIDPATVYTSSDESVASVSSTGSVRGLSVGTATISVEGGGLQGSIEITVASLPRLVGMDFDETGPLATEEILTWLDLLGPLDAFTGAPGWEVNPNTENPSNGSGALHITSDGIEDTLEQFSRLAIVKADVFDAEDVEFSADITWDDPSGDANDRAGIYARFIDENNWYYALIVARDDDTFPTDTVELYRRKGGVDSLLATSSSSSAVSEGDTATLTLRIQGNEVSVLVNGRAVAGLDPFVDDDPVSGVGRVGVGQRTNPSYYDNLTFQSLDLVEIDFDTTGPTGGGELLAFFDLFGFDPEVGSNWTIEENVVNNDNRTGALRTSTDEGQLIDQFSRVAILKSSVVNAENVAFEVDVTWADNDFAGVYARFSDDQQNFYYVVIEGNDDPEAGPMRLFRRKDGVDATLATTSSPVGVAPLSTHRVGIMVTGNNPANIFVTVDGVPVPGLDPFIDDNPVTGSGRVGVGQQTNPTYYDNFSIQALVVAEAGDPPALVSDDTVISVLGCDFTAASFETSEDVTVDGVTATITGGGAAPGVTVTSGSLQVSLDAALPFYEWLRLDVDVTGVDSGLSATLTVFMAHTPLDINGDGRTNISDATAFGTEFNGGKDPNLIDENCDGIVNIQDATAFGAVWNAGAANSGPLPDKP